MKKIGTLLLVSLMFLSVFSACSQDSAPASKAEPTVASAVNESGEPAQASTGIPKEDIKIGVLCFGTEDDGGWTQSHYKSFLRTKDELGLADEQVIMMDNVPEDGPDAENVTEQLISDGCNVIFGTSSGHATALYSAAERNPDVYFHMFEGQRDMPNCASFSGRDYEAVFMVGYVAAKVSEGDTLGFVAAQPHSAVIRAINSWARGAQLANPNAKVQVVWVNSWFDPAADKEAANALIDEGCTVIGYQGSSSAVMTAAEEAGVYATGYHIDMQPLAPNAVITSYMWNWTPIYNKFIQGLIDGTWTNETMYLGIEADVATHAPYNAAIVSADIIAEADKVEAQLKDGSLKVFEGPLKDNQGSEVLAAGKEFTLDELINMKYLGDNVIGVL